MLEKVDLSIKASKQDYKQRMPLILDRLYTLQKATWDAGVPVAIIFEGWDAAGKGSSIQKLTSRLDPRGFKLHPIREARTYEKKRPWLWRFWLKIPARGEIAIFDRSWYGRVLVERVESLIPEADWRRAYRDIVDFERNLADDGTLIIKFFLHISREEQKNRFKKLLKDPLTAWHVEAEDWEHHARYDEYVLAIEEMLERTETEWGPWTIVEATNRRHTQLKIAETILNRLERRLADMDALPEIPSEEIHAEVEVELVAEPEAMPEAEPEAMPEAEVATEPVEKPAKVVQPKTVKETAPDGARPARKPRTRKAPTQAASKDSDSAKADA
jgi:polyphosphate kinase 2 (PPK2 family)